MTSYPSESIEAKWRAVHTLKYGLDDSLSPPEDAVGRLKMSRLITAGLMASDSYFVSPQVCAAIQQAGVSLPGDHIISEGALPSDSWIWIDGGIETGFDFLKGWPEDQRAAVKSCSRVVALMCSSRIHKDRDIFSVVPFLECVDGIPLPPFMDAIPYMYDITIGEADEVIKENGQADGIEGAGVSTAILRWLVAFGAWTDQRVARVEKVPMERHARKRIDRIATPDFNRSLSVVILRRAEGDSDARLDESGDSHWTCQWVVSGHWRHQYHPSDGSRKLRWILPYVKGPDDKPLKPPSERVFAVIR